MKQLLCQKYVTNKVNGEYFGLLLKFRKKAQKQAAIKKEIIKRLETKCNILRERSKQIEKLIAAMTHG